MENASPAEPQVFLLQRVIETSDRLKALTVKIVEYNGAGNDESLMLRFGAALIAMDGYQALVANCEKNSDLAADDLVKSGQDAGLAIGGVRLSLLKHFEKATGDKRELFNDALDETLGISMRFENAKNQVSLSERTKAVGGAFVDLAGGVLEAVQDLEVRTDGLEDMIAEAQSKLRANDQKISTVSVKAKEAQSMLEDVRNDTSEASGIIGRAIKDMDDPANDEELGVIKPQTPHEP